MDEEDKKKEEGEGEEKTADDTGEGDKSELVKQTELANAAAERMEKATEELNAAEARRKLGGMTEAGQVEKKKPLTPEEVAERVAKGDMNPLAEDGYL